MFTFSKIKYIYKKCITKRDFIKGLQSFTQKRYSNYTVLYIAYHGRKNRICIGNEYITLKEIADVLEDKLNGIIVHFGSCSTLNTTEKISQILLNVQDALSFQAIRKMCHILTAVLLNYFTLMY